MLCDVCHTQKATVHLTEIVNGQVAKLNMCEYCAKKKGNQVEQHFGIADLLQGLVETENPTPLQVGRRIKCANCGMTYEDFKHLGRLGCGNCYLAFHENLLPLLKRVHGAQKHKGKVVDGSEKNIKQSSANTKTYTSKELDEMKAMLHSYIQKEMYEDAAQLRDQIRKIESK